MKADPRFLSQPKEFWANVRTISQEVGYTERGADSIKIPSLESVRTEFTRLGLSAAHIADSDNTLTEFGQCLFDYFTFRATILNGTVRHHFMKKDSAQIGRAHV